MMYGLFGVTGTLQPNKNGHATIVYSNTIIARKIEIYKSDLPNSLTANILPEVIN